MKCLCSSNYLMPCLAKIEGQLKTEARRLSKESQKVERTLKEGMLNNKNKDDSEAHNEAEKKKRF